VKFLADENIFLPVISHLRDLGHNVKGVQESDFFQATDDAVVSIATEEERTILTFDKHFGDILRYQPHKLPGIILIRIHPPLLKDIIYSINNLFIIQGPVVRRQGAGKNRKTS
jgi:predicted nuclease of predicted toxin-antitoxin system